MPTNYHFYASAKPEQLCWPQANQLFQFYMDAYERRIQSWPNPSFYDYKFLPVQPLGLL